MTHSRIWPATSEPKLGSVSSDLLLRLCALSYIREAEGVSTSIAWWSGAVQATYVGETGWSGWKRVEPGAIRQRCLSKSEHRIKNKIQCNACCSKRKRNDICQIVPNPNKYSMAFQISQADLVNKQITVPHNKTSLSCFIHNWNCGGVLAVLALHTSEEIEVTAFSRLIPEVRTTWSWAWRWCCEVHAEP